MKDKEEMMFEGFHVIELFFFLIGTKNILETFSKQSVCSVSLKTRLTGKA